MTKQAKEQKVSTKTRFYKKAAFPWAIIGITIIIGISFVTGWFANQANSHYITMQAEALASKTNQ